MRVITHLFAGVPVSDLDAGIDRAPPDFRVGTEMLWEIAGTAACVRLGMAARRH